LYDTEGSGRDAEGFTLVKKLDESSLLGRFVLVIGFVLLEEPLNCIPLLQQVFLPPIVLASLNRQRLLRNRHLPCLAVSLRSFVDVIKLRRTQGELSFSWICVVGKVLLAILIFSSREAALHSRVAGRHPIDDWRSLLQIHHRVITFLFLIVAVDLERVILALIELGPRLVHKLPQLILVLLLQRLRFVPPQRVAVHMNVLLLQNFLVVEHGVLEDLPLPQLDHLRVFLKDTLDSLSVLDDGQGNRLEGPDYGLTVLVQAFLGLLLPFLPGRLQLLL